MHCDCCTSEIVFAALSYLLPASGISLQLRGQHGKNQRLPERKRDSPGKGRDPGACSQEIVHCYLRLWEDDFLALATNTLKHED